MESESPPNNQLYIQSSRLARFRSTKPIRDDPKLIRNMKHEADEKNPRPSDACLGPGKATLQASADGCRPAGERVHTSQGVRSKTRAMGHGSGERLPVAPTGCLDSSPAGYLLRRKDEGHSHPGPKMKPCFLPRIRCFLRGEMRERMRCILRDSLCFQHFPTTYWSKKKHGIQTTQAVFWAQFRSFGNFFEKNYRCAIQVW